MLKYLSIALTAGLLAACGGQGGSGGTEPEGETAEAVDAPSPLMDYLPWDADADGVQTTESGLQYIIVREGAEDGAMPTPRDRVEVMYEGRLPDGTKFDSSYDRGTPASFGVTQVISGWTEGLQLMSEGDEFVFYIPNELAYGNESRGDVIKAGDDLVFRVELKGIDEAPPPKEVDAEAWAAHTPWQSDQADVQSLEGGVEYVVIESGAEDGATPAEGNMVVVWYEGRLAETNEVIDSAYARGEPGLFVVGELLPGMKAAIGQMRPGDRWLVYVPSGQAYGSEGFRTVPPDADLVFELELVDVLPVN